MSNVRSYNDAELIERVKGLSSFDGLPNGILDVWVRSNEDEFDKFDDKVYTFDCSGGIPNFIMVCSGTTNAGAVGLKHYARWNSRGCAILKANEIVYNSHVWGLHKGQYAAYVQAKGFAYYRDNNKNDKAEEIGQVYYDIIGANCHKAGWRSNHIGGWSVACLVRNVEPQFKAWMKFMNQRPLSVCILQEF